MLLELLSTVMIAFASAIGRNSESFACRVGVKSSSSLYLTIKKSSFTCSTEMVRCQMAQSLKARLSVQTVNMCSKYLDVISRRSESLKPVSNDNNNIQ